MIPMKVAHNFMTRKNESPVRIGMDASLVAHHSSVNNLKNGGQATGRDSDIGLRITNQMVDEAHYASQRVFAVHNQLKPKPLKTNSQVMQYRPVTSTQFSGQIT